MDFSITWDPTISIEGTATALGVVGAAIGYLTNLINGALKERRNTLYRGTRLVILDLLECDPWQGLTEDQIWNLYRAEKPRKHYTALSPKKLTKLGLKRELKQLQLQFLIDLCGKDSYRIRMSPVSKYDLQKSGELSAIRLFTSSVTRDDLVHVTKRILGNAESKW